MLEGRAATECFKLPPPKRPGPKPKPRSLAQRTKDVDRVIHRMQRDGADFRNIVSQVAKEARVARGFARKRLKELGAYVKPRRFV